jgi:hypothetical protein
MTPLDASEVAKLLAEYGRRTALVGGKKPICTLPKAWWRSLSRWIA